MPKKLKHQFKLPLITVEEDDLKELQALLEDIYQSVSYKFKSKKKLEEVLTKKAHFVSVDVESDQTPEEFTKDEIIAKLISFLGYTKTSETQLKVPAGFNYPDYILKSDNKESYKIYVEAEPINTDLRDKNHGVGQVDHWLSSRYAVSSYGIGTDGLIWILHVFNPQSKRIDEILKVDLRKVFIKIHNPNAFLDENELKNILENFLQLHIKNIGKYIGDYREIGEEIRENISKKFYEEYVKWVFGVDKNGKPLTTNCLLRSIKAPSGNGENNRLFSVVLMNRLIFIKFLEDRGIVKANLLEQLHKEYKKSGIIASFYNSFLKPLFYEVMNRDINERRSKIKNNSLYASIPYLNGGLFREIIPNEKGYNVEDKGMELIIEFIEEYSFSMGPSQNINPDILGYVFEKTINFISGIGTDIQKMRGAYYTPDDVVHFIIENTITPIIFEKMLEGLKNAGWEEKDVKGFKNINDILSNPPRNTLDIEKIIEAIDTIKILDPACGSGHFLTAAFSELYRIKTDLYRIADRKIDSYQMKKEILSKNLFGVDIDENAVEIARLRLWLSVIEEVTDDEHVNTLPNIDFNIFCGNSLIGWLDEKLLYMPATRISDDEDTLRIINDLKTIYPDEMKKIEKMLENYDLNKTMEACNELVTIYALESGPKSMRLRNLIEVIRMWVYKLITNGYFAYISHYSIKISTKNRLLKNIKQRKPFHWQIDFKEVLNSGGFDVIIGNPPYIENSNYNPDEIKIIQSRKNKKPEKSKKNKETVPLIYYSQTCGNTHAYFTERSIKLLKDKGRFGFIVPISLVSTDRMSAIREYLHENSSKNSIWYYNFDDRPGKIFSGLEHCRATIVIIKKGNGTDSVYTSKYHRWFTKDRTSLFDRLKTTKWKLIENYELIPKIGTKLDNKIISKLHAKTKGKTINDLLKEDGKGEVWYHNAPQYWIHVHTQEYLPKLIEKKDGKTTERISDQYKRLKMSKSDVPIVLGILNSSLFYWWYIAWSDGRHLLDQHIRPFPLDTNNFPGHLKRKIQKLSLKLMEEFEQNSNIKRNQRKGGYEITIKEIIPSKSKNTIDLIDDILGDYYKLTKEEKNYIKTFDKVFRMGE